MYLLDNTSSLDKITYWKYTLNRDHNSIYVLEIYSG